MICTKQNGENFFEVACRVKQLDLGEAEIAASKCYLQDASVSGPYLVALQGIFRQQLQARMGTVAVSSDFLDQKIARLMRTFLKDKLGQHREVQPAVDLAERARWDPHYHGGALFADSFPKAKLYLPNYEEAYVYMRGEHGKLKDRISHIHQAMEKDSFTEFTESGCGYDLWKISHVGKRIIPILCHKREYGAVFRSDVTGYDVCGLEPEDRFISQKEFLKSVRKNSVVRIHMGETIVPASGRENVRRLLDEADLYYTSSKPLRIGHGTHTSIEDMLRMKEKGIVVEACLSSNKRTGILDKRSDYPLGVMLLLGVKVVIGTDGGPLYSTTLAKEYAYAARNLEKFREKLESSDAPVVLPNGDRLLYRHILPHACEEGKGDETVTYKALGAWADPTALKQLTPETLVANAAELFELCYRNKSPKAKYLPPNAADQEPHKDKKEAGDCPRLPPLPDGDIARPE